MSMRIRLLLGVTLALAAFLVLPTVSLAASPTAAAVHAQRKSQSNTFTLNLTFASLVTHGPGANNYINGVVDGDLTLVFNQDGSFTASLSSPIFGSQSPLKGFGRESRSGHVTLTFPLGSNSAFEGQAQVNSSTNVGAGTFQIITNGQRVQSGIWSALPVSSTNELTFGFAGQDTKGPDTGVVYVGGIALNNQTLKGRMNLANGTVVVVAAKVEQGNVSVTFNLGGGEKIFGVARPTTLHGVPVYKGTFVGPQTGDQGVWYAYALTFA